jgi:V8-like Glu-specific endopeptidase
VRGVPAAIRALAAFLVLSGSAAAQEPGRRMLEADEAAAFRGVGRLNVAGTRFCTATLISETVIITAAHCLFNPRSHERVPIGEFRFVAGLRLGKTAAVRRAVRAVTHPEFAFNIPTPADVGTDMALIELDRPVPAEDAAAFETAALGVAPLAIVSYARDRAQAPSIQEPCGLATTFAAVAAIDCAVTYGASGAPVFESAGEDRRLVAVVSAMGNALSTGREVTLTVLVAGWIEPLLAALSAAPRDE